MLKQKQDAGACRVVTQSEYISVAGGEGRSAFDGYPVLNQLPIVLGASPSVVSNVANVPVIFAVSGGTVSSIEFSYDGTNYINTGVLGGMFPVEPGCSLRITHTVAPTVTQLRHPAF